MINIAKEIIANNPNASIGFMGAATMDEKNFLNSINKCES
jgi:hypothetical protein